MPTELLYLAVAIAVIGLVLFVLRRAAAKSRAQAPTSIQDRLGLKPEAEARPERIHRRRPGEAEKPAEAPPKTKPARAAETAEPGDKAEPKAPAAPEAAAVEVDADAREAYRAGLAKTRGGFVAKLGKLFGKKKIDEEMLGELEETLFTADIGPRAADRIFQSVKSGLSKADLESADKIWSQIRQT